MVTALITGASSGLGAEYARQLAGRGADLVLVGRDRVALEELSAAIRAERGVVVEVLRADLLDRRQLARVARRLADTDRPIEMLVNNVGFGLPLAFEDADIDAEVDHLRLHVEVPLRLSHAVLAPMLARGHGRIVNIASVAGLIPRGTYGACKGWLVSFSRWANVRYAPRGVTVTAVCPGFTHTRFHERMGLSAGNEGVPDWMWLDAPDVVRESLRDIARGKSVSLPSWRYRALVLLSRILPDSVIVRAGDRGRATSEG